MNCTVLITVRTASKRLPSKALLKINGNHTIKFLIDRLTNNNIRKIIVCTTNEKSDDRLVKILQKEGIEVFRGDNLDILNRLYTVSKKYHLKYFVVVEGDDILCDPLLIKKTCVELTKNKSDYYIWEKLPFGVSPIGIRTNKLQALIEKKLISNTETGWGDFITKSGLFKIKTLTIKNKKIHRPDIRLTLDYKEDLKFIKKILLNFNKNFSLVDIIELLDKNPKWMKINESVKEKYTINFNEKKISNQISDNM